MNSEELKIEVDLQGFTYAERPSLLPELAHAIEAAGGWILERRQMSSVADDVYLELPAGSLPEVYGALLACGLELTRNGHRSLAERCNCDMHLPQSSLLSILTIRLEIRFLVDPVPLLDLSRMLMLGSAAA